MDSKLYRSRRKRIFGGVGGGLGDYFDIDPILIRIIFVVLTLINGIGILLYIILWIIVPEESFESAYSINPEKRMDENKQRVEEKLYNEYKKSRGNGVRTFGIILIVLGSMVFLIKIVPQLYFSDIYPILFILIGGALIWKSFNHKPLS